MTRRIEVAMRQGQIEELDWMGPATSDRRSRSCRRLQSTRSAYPDRCARHTGAVAVKRGDSSATSSARRSSIAPRPSPSIGKPLDRGRVAVTPPTVNAYYNPQMNDINFRRGRAAAAALRPEDGTTRRTTATPAAHRARAHHGFDDEGRQFDAQGNLKDWWTPRTRKAFEERAQCIVDQYAQYTIVDDIKINSKLTLGEDVADLGGLILAWMAWKAETAGKKLEDATASRPSSASSSATRSGPARTTAREPAREGAHRSALARQVPRERLVVNMPEFEKAFSCKRARRWPP
jgi:endothelin-converting enzyme/putative endopeptidase